MGVEILNKHLHKRDSIVIVVDPDADGYTSSALLVNYIREVTDNKYPFIFLFHEGKEHGLSDLISQIDLQNNGLIICADSASNDYEEHEQLARMGMDILVLDHHEADKISEHACIINNQLSPNYPNKDFSGVGITYKFCKYYDKVYGYNCADKYIDLVALGNISDMMNVTSLETHYYIQRGLLQIYNPFFAAMVEKQAYSLGDELNPIGIAFYITPYINATIRSGTQEDKKLLFESMLDLEAQQLIPSTKRGHEMGEQETLVTQVVRNCTNIKRHQDDEKKMLSEQIKEEILENNLETNQIIFVKLQKPINKNLVGLLANQIMSEFQKPTIILNKSEIDGKLYWQGSARNVGHTDLRLKDFMNDSQLVDYAEGHQSAFGLSIPDTNFINIIQYSNEKLADYDFTACYKVDKIYDYKDITSKDIFDIGALNAYYGQGFEEPYIAIENIPIGDNITLMSPDKRPTINIQGANGINYIKFKSSEEEMLRLKPLNPLQVNYINIVGRCNINYWNGNYTAQILVEEYEIKSSRYNF